MRMRVFMKKLRVEIENETRVYLESLNFDIEMRASQKSAKKGTKTDILLILLLGSTRQVQLVLRVQEV